jgi:outer membrane protein assembly factor BamA
LKIFTCLLSLIAIFSFSEAFSQANKPTAAQQNVAADSPGTLAADSAGQKDLIDFIQKILDKKTSPEKRNLQQKASFSIIPYGGYTLSTGFSVNISGNVVFFTDQSHRQNISVLDVDASYDSKSQKIILTRSEIWTSNNDYKIVSDLRWERYPTETYGLGTFTTFNTDSHLDYYYVRVYETVLKKVATNYYAGIGYNLDYHYNITAIGNTNNTISDYSKYGQTSHSTSSGINFDFLYDDRKNPLNPLSGFYANAVFRQNAAFMGSNANWQSLQLDFRKYFKLSPKSNNVLAFWSIVSLTSGNVPYLDLPSTGSDMYNNSGRGYAVGRFRGRDMLYLESEYRFGITKNGLLGAVLFANAQSFTEYQTNAFERIAPAAGTGLRIKINKHSNTNICIDYGAGVSGSRGFFVNLGEVF